MKYDYVNPFDKLREDEPWFFLRAQDALAVPLLQQYYHYLWAYHQGKDQPTNQLIELSKLIKDFEQWQIANTTKIPD